MEAGKTEIAMGIAFVLRKGRTGKDWGHSPAGHPSGYATVTRCVKGVRGRLWYRIVCFCATMTSLCVFYVILNRRLYFVFGSDICF